MTPTGSWPRISPGRTGYSPRTMWTSVPQMVVAVMRITASPKPARGRDTSSTAMQSFPLNTTAFIVAIRAPCRSEGSTQETTADCSEHCRRLTVFRRPDGPSGQAGRLLGANAGTVSGHAAPTAVAEHPHVGIAQRQLRGLALLEPDQMEREPDNGGIAEHSYGEVVL